jgi:signal transduction histidine kinase
MSVLHFSVDSALLRELGEKLVETVHIALIELVKNSYDADASEVDIVFTRNNGMSEIHIVDNGKGMNYHAVEKYWMRIATTNKEKSNVSSVYGRPLTGAKGIGRFSCRRLGGHLRLITAGTKNNNVTGIQPEVEQTIVDFPWTEFEPGQDVTDIECVGSRELEKESATGTTLIISDIAEEWNQRGWNVLKRQLSVLSANTGIKREEFEEDPGFTIRIIAPEFEGGVRDLREDFLNAGWGTLTATINKQHQAVCKLDALGIGHKTITSTTKFTHLKDVSLKLGIMVDDRSQMRDISTLSKGNLQQILPSWGGVQVRYRSFRVFPYGDDDWLDIDHDRGLRKRIPKNDLFAFAETLKGVDASRALLNSLSMRSYLGNVTIGEDAEGFEMKLNREGFVQSTAVDELKEFVRYAIDWSTILRDFYIRNEAQRQSIKAVNAFQEEINQKLEPTRYIESAITFLERRVDHITEILPFEEKQEFQESFFKATDVIRKHNESNKAELLHLRLVASTSTLLLIFSHEVKSLLGLLEQSKNSLTQMATKLPPQQRNDVLAITGTFVDLKDRLEDLLKMTALVGVDQRDAKPGQVALKDKLKKVENVFSLICKKYNIEIDYSDVPNNIALKDILEAEVYSIFLNIFSNSIKSVIAAGKNRKIEVSASRKDGKTIIIVRDSGVGIKPDRYEEIFIPFISDPTGDLYSNLSKRLNPEDKLIVGSGSGLGLGIVREIVLAHEGSVKFVAPSLGWNAELQIEIP